MTDSQMQAIVDEMGRAMDDLELFQFPTEDGVSACL
jgi:hypothetical protein